MVVQKKRNRGKIDHTMSETVRFLIFNFAAYGLILDNSWSEASFPFAAGAAHVFIMQSNDNFVFIFLFFAFFIHESENCKQFKCQRDELSTRGSRNLIKRHRAVSCLRKIKFRRISISIYVHELEWRNKDQGSDVERGENVVSSDSA